MKEIRLPQYGMGMTDGTITRWYKAVGDKIVKGEMLCEIEAAKTMMDMEAPDSGVLRRILVEPDDNVPVNTVIAEMELADTAGDDGKTLETPSSAEPEAPPATTQGPIRAAAPARGATAAVAVQVEPAARRFAKELGVDLSQIVGSGPSGRILAADVQSHAENSAIGATSQSISAMSHKATEAAAISEDSVKEIPHSITKRTIARRLTESKQQVPHFYVKATCRVDPLTRLREDLKAHGVSINDMLVKAVALTLTQVPEMNVSWAEKSLLSHPHVDVSVAVATSRGLITPIVRKANLKTPAEIGAELKALISRAREGKLKPEEYNGGTVSISNMGMLEVEEFSAIVNPPQAAIFAIGATQSRPVVEGDSVKVGRVMSVTISVDHRAVDGAIAARGLKAFKGLVESPELLR